MNYTEAIEYIHQIPKFRRPLGNAALAELLGHLGDPQKELRFVHIAGTNGKGSVAAMTAEILRRSGFKTGLYTSPFIDIFNERIRVNGENIPDEELSRIVSRVKDVMEASGAYVSEFAFITAAAMLWFKESKCSVVVLEAGMGGRYDATNVIEKSAVSVICKLSLDHTQYLGDTIEQIAAEKCGIIKDGCPVIAYPCGSLAHIIENAAKEKNTYVTFAQSAEASDSGFIYKGREYPLSLKGTYQPQNAAVVIEVIEALKKSGMDISDSALADGLGNTVWHARFEFVTPDIVIDGAHNPDAMLQLRRSLEETRRDTVIIMAMMEDKAYEECVRIIAPAAKIFIATELYTARCLKAERLAAAARKVNVPSLCRHTFEDALREAQRERGALIAVCGSLYLASEARSYLTSKKTHVII